MGIIRYRAFGTREVVFARSKIASRAKSGWHHHGKRHPYGFFVFGRLRFDFGENGRDSVEVDREDFFHIPVRLVHRDVNPDLNEEAVVCTFS